MEMGLWSQFGFLFLHQARNLLTCPGVVPSSFKELWLAVTMRERASFRLAHGCCSSSAQVSHGLLSTYHHAPLPCHVRNWRVEMAGGQALRFGLEMTVV